MLTAVRNVCREQNRGKGRRRVSITVIAFVDRLPGYEEVDGPVAHQIGKVSIQLRISSASTDPLTDTAVCRCFHMRRRAGPNARTFFVFPACRSSTAAVQIFQMRAPSCSGTSRPAMPGTTVAAMSRPLSLLLLFILLLTEASAQQCGAGGVCKGRCESRGWAQWQYCQPLCARRQAKCAGTCPSGAKCGGASRCQVTCSRRFGRFCPWTRRAQWRYRNRWERVWVRAKNGQWKRQWKRRPRWVRVHTWARVCKQQNYHVCSCHSPCTCRGSGASGVPVWVTDSSPPSSPPGTSDSSSTSVGVAPSPAASTGRVLNF